jgi:hypothetical protein
LALITTDPQASSGVVPSAVAACGDESDRRVLAVYLDTYGGSSTPHLTAERFGFGTNKTARAAGQLSVAADDSLE